MSAPEKTRSRAAPPRPAARELLLEAASALMTERETVDVPLADIAARAEVNVALVSYYFGGKEGLLLALAKRDAARALGDLDRLMSLNLSPQQKLRRHLSGVIETFYRYPYLNRLLHTLMRDASTESAKEISHFFTEPLAETARLLIQSGAERGEIRDFDPMLFYFAAMGACEQIFSSQATLKFVYGVNEIDDDLRKRYTELVLDLLMYGFMAPEAGTKLDKA